MENSTFSQDGCDKDYDYSLFIVDAEQEVRDAVAEATEWAIMHERGAP